jgi:hypothetical protein
MQALLLGGSLIFLLLVAAGFWAHLSRNLAIALAATALPLALGVAFYFAVILLRRRAGDDFKSARLLAHRAPSLSLELLAAAELDREMQQDAPFSRELAERFLQKAGRGEARAATELLETRGVRGAKRAAVAALATGALAMGFAGKAWMAGVTKVFQSTSATAEVRRVVEPITGDVELQYRYPPYTGLAPQTVPGTNGEIRGPVGTEVLLSTKSDRPVHRAELSVGGKTLPLTVEQGRDLKGSLVIESSGNYSFIYFSEKKELARGPPIEIVAEPDVPPQVTLQTPGEEIEVDPGQKVTLKYEAKDDYGISELALVYKAPRDAQETRVPLSHADGLRAHGQHVMHLGPLKLLPGDRVTYHIEAMDNDEVTGKKRGASRTHVFKVYSAAEHRQQAAEKIAAAWEKLLTHLADRLEGPELARDEKSVEAVTQGQRVDQSGLALANELSQLARTLSEERDAPQELWSAASHVAQGLRSKVSASADARRTYLRVTAAAGVEAGFSRRLWQALSSEVARVEKDALYLESLLDRVKLQQLEEMAQALSQERRALAQLLEDYKKTQSTELRESILQKIDAIKRRIDELAQKMAELAKGIRDEHINAEALQGMMEQQDFSGMLEDIEKLVQEGKTDEALAKLQEMSMQMDQMMQSLEGAENSMGENQYPELAQKFQEFTDELKEVESEQNRLADATRQIRDRVSKEMKERMAERAQQVREALLKQAERLEREYRGLSPEQLHPMAERPLEEVQSEMENVKNALKVSDYDLAAEAAAKADRAAEELAVLGQQQRRLEDMLQGMPPMRGQWDKNAKKLESDREQVADLRRKLEQLLPSPGSMMSEADKQKLKELSGQQGQLGKRTSGLRQKLEEMQQMAPLFGDDAADQLSEAKEHMGKAAQKMDAANPAQGAGEQQAALEKLSEFGERLKQSGKNKGSRGGLPMPLMAGRRPGQGGDSSREKVEIPDADQFQSPQEFRKDLLDAMKQGSPDKYREQVKRYYEELVK